MIKDSKRFIKQDGKLVIETKSYSQVKDTGMTFYAADPSDLKQEDKKHLVYKLVQTPTPVGGKYFWSGIWNSCCYISHRINPSKGYREGNVQYVFDTIEEAIEKIMLNGYVVATGNIIDVYKRDNLDFQSGIAEKS